MERPALRLVGVHEVDAAAGSVRRRREVERRRCLRFLVRLDGTHLARRDGQAAEVARRDRIGGLDLAPRALDDLGAVSGVVGLVGVERLAHRGDVGVAELARNRGGLLADQLELFEARNRGSPGASPRAWSRRGSSSRTAPRHRAAPRCLRLSGQTRRSPRARRDGRPSAGWTSCSTACADACAGLVVELGMGNQQRRLVYRRLRRRGASARSPARRQARRLFGRLLCRRAGSRGARPGSAGRPLAGGWLDRAAPGVSSRWKRDMSPGRFCGPAIWSIASK